MREYLAEMGFRSLNDIIGHTELIETNPSVLDFSRLLNKEVGELHFTGGIHQPSVPLGMQGTVLDQQMMNAAAAVIGDYQSAPTIDLDYAIKNTDRAVGAMLSGVIAKKYGLAGLPEDTISIK